MTGALTVKTTDLQRAIAEKLDRELGISLGMPTKDELIREEFHGTAPAKVRIAAR